MGVLALLTLLLLAVLSSVSSQQRRPEVPECAYNSDCPVDKLSFCRYSHCTNEECRQDRDCPDGFFCDTSGEQKICRNRLRQTIQELTNRLDQENLQRATLESRYNALVDSMNRVPKLERPLPDKWREGTNFPGSDIRNMSLVDGSPGQCEHECISDQRCKAWSFVLPGVQGPLAQCWLKNNGSIQGVPDPKVISGVVQR